MKVKSWPRVLLVLCLSVTWSQAGGEDEVTLPPGAGPGNRLLRSGATPEDQDAEDRREQYPYVASPIRKFDKEDETIYEEHSGLEFPTPDSSTSETLNDVPNSIESLQFSKESPRPLDEIEAEESQVYRNTSLTSPPVELLPGVQLVTLSSHRPRSFSSFFDNHALRISLPAVADAASNLVSTARFGFGKNSFLTGFGLGFMAFGLKKLLLPVFIGMQIVKSVLVAMFLPTILSHVGKLVGKGVSSVASGSSAGQQQHDVGDFEFKDTTDLDQDGAGSDGTAMWTIPSQSHATLAALNPPFAQPTKDFGERYTPVNSKLPALPTKHHGSFYTKDPHQDYKIFHKIPNSSQLLAHYDPFYSPLLSRLDSVFQQLGTTAELCRQRLICDMYSNPAKFAPYSNLVSAQLSRELNELRKPSSDNPEILRFFRYMKAAKDGQDGMSCQIVYSGCVAPTAPTQGSPMIETFNQINKLVHARNLKH